jgi:hypothetical protein
MNKYLTNTTLVLAAISILGIGALTALISGFTILSWHNTASSLKTSYEMKVKANSGEINHPWDSEKHPE